MTNVGNGGDAVAAFARHIAAVHEHTETARAALADTTASAASADGAVRVTVDTAGVLTGIEFGAAMRVLDPSDLAATVLRTVVQARVNVLRDAQRKVAAAVGESSEAVAVLERQRAELEAPPTIHPSAGDDGEDGYSALGR